MIASVELAIINRLTAASDQDLLGYPLKAESYGGQLDNENELAKIANRLPCTLVTCTGVSKGKDNGSSYREEGTFAVLCVARSLRNERATRHGGLPGEVGTYQMRRDVMALLCGQTLGLGNEISPLTPHGTRILFNGQLRSLSLSVVAVEFATGWNVTPAADAITAATLPGEAGAGITNFTFFTGNWDVPVPAIRDEVTLNKE